MKKVFQALMAVLAMTFLMVTFAQADEAASNSPATAPAKPASTPAPKAKIKKAKTSKKKEAKDIWVCPMGDYSGPKTANGKCPTCGMDLEKKPTAKK